MNPIITHFYGDIHIHVTFASANRLMLPVGKQYNDTARAEDVTKCSGYQELVQSIGDFLHETADEYEEFDNGAEDADIDSIVVVMYPGKPPKVMTESECYDMVESRGTFCSGFTIDDPGICAYGLKAVYDPRTLLPLGSDCYIIGPVIVYASDENGDSISLDAEEVMAAIVHFAEHTVTLCADGADLPAFRM